MGNNTGIKDTDLFGGTFEYKKPEGNQLPGRNKSGAWINNPMWAVYGKTEGERCKNCAFLVAKRMGKIYYKCELRGNVDKCSPKSDHKVNWTACGKFEKEE